MSISTVKHLVYLSKQMINSNVKYNLKRNKNKIDKIYARIAVKQNNNSTDILLT